MTTKIGWTEETWNPVVGCTRVSEGCRNCYAEKMTYRLERMGQKDYKGLTALNGKGERRFNGTVCCLPHKLDQPLKWKKPRTIFVNSMSDLFHKDVPFEFIDQVFEVMAICPQHTFQVLTKRPERMMEYANRVAQSKPHDEVNIAVFDAANAIGVHGDFAAWPLPNVWLGTSIEDQKTADQRIPHLLECPAAVRFLSIEPLLGPIRHDFTGIDWVIIGCEKLAGGVVGRIGGSHWNQDNWFGWVDKIIEQCKTTGVKLFVKQIPHGKKVTTDLDKFPEHLRLREIPERK